MRVLPYIGDIATAKEEELMPIVLDLKMASVIDTYSQRYGVTIEEAMDLFYTSHTMSMIERGVADLHCRSDIYLADELHLELEERKADSIL